MNQDLYHKLFLQSKETLSESASKEGQLFFDRISKEIEVPAIYEKNSFGCSSYLIAKAAKRDAVIAYEVLTGQPYANPA